MQTTVVAAPPTLDGHAPDAHDHLREATRRSDSLRVFVEGDRRFLGPYSSDVLARAPVLGSPCRRSCWQIAGACMSTRTREEVGGGLSATTSSRRRGGRRRPAARSVITIDDIVDVIQEAATKDIKALGGVSRREFRRSVISIARHRFVWLFVNLFTAFVASGVLSLFEVSLQKMVALAILAPIVAKPGGQAATQTMTVAVRAGHPRDGAVQRLADHPAGNPGRLDERTRLRGSSPASPPPSGSASTRSALSSAAMSPI